MQRPDARLSLLDVLSVTWWLTFAPLLALECRYLYEEIWLTYQRGKQMIGFSLIHVHPLLALIGFIGVAGSILWSVVALVGFAGPQYRSTHPLFKRLLLTLGVLLLLFLPVDRLILALR